MLGWHIIIYPKPDDLVWRDKAHSRVLELDHSNVMAVWTAGLGGARWLDELAEAGKAELLALNGGYPMIYEFDLDSLPPILADPPSLMGTVTLKNEACATTSLIAVVWDQS